MYTTLSPNESETKLTTDVLKKNRRKRSKHTKRFKRTHFLIDNVELFANFKRFATDKQTFNTQESNERNKKKQFSIVARL